MYILLKNLSQKASLILFRKMSTNIEHICHYSLQNEFSAANLHVTTPIIFHVYVIILKNKTKQKTIDIEKALTWTL